MKKQHYSFITSDEGESSSEYIPRKRKKSEKRNIFHENPVFRYYNTDERKYYRNLCDEDKLFIARSEDKIQNINNVKIPLRFKIIESKIDDNIKAIAIRKMDYLYDLEPSSGEYFKTVSWIESVCSLPIGIYKNLSINYESPKYEIKHFLENAKNHMDNTVYGHFETKNHIIRILAQWIVNPDANGIVMGIYGPMGCGKTTLIKDGICSVLNLPFAFIPLGGTSDSAYLEGHSYTYEGATWGKIVDILMKVKCMNPVFYFDELDKISETSKGDEITNILMHLTDNSQNSKFHDKYFTDFEFDLSKCLIIFSYNDENKINPILKDRMIQIETKGYTLNEKISIAYKHLLPCILNEYKFNQNDIEIPYDNLVYIIQKTDHEDGVRNLKRSLSNIISHLNLKRITDDNFMNTGKNYKITKKDIDTFLGNKKLNTNLLSMYT